MLDGAVETAAEVLAFAWRHWALLLVAAFVAFAFVCNIPDCGGPQ